MSGAGRVISIDPASEPKGNRPARMVITDRDAPVMASGLRYTAFWLPATGPAPAIGEMVSWGPHHAWWGDPVIKVAKIGNEFDPNDPALFTG